MSSERPPYIPYPIMEGRIHAYTCEINIAHHCNLTCRSCGHLSPVAKRHNTTPESVYADLRVLSKHYVAEHVRLLGGEPLLHPALLEVMRAVLSSGVTQKVRVVTNGLLLWRMPNEFWHLAGEVHVSVYPGRELTGEQRRVCERRAAEFGVVLEFLYFDRFRESYTELGTQNLSLVKRIYRSCQIAHRWQCHNVEAGYFFKCPQAHMLPSYLSGAGLRAGTDGILIEDVPELKRRLLDYLEAAEPLASCRHCLGSVGKLFPHEEVRRAEWREPQNLRTEDLLDREHLTLLEADPDADTLCLRSHIE